VKHFLLTSCDIFTRVIHEGHVDGSKNQSCKNVVENLSSSFLKFILLIILRYNVKLPRTPIVFPRSFVLHKKLFLSHGMSPLQFSAPALILP
jgi:hypothetical protein